MEKSALAKAKSFIAYAFRGFDPHLGFIFLGLAGISFVVFCQPGKAPPLQLLISCVIYSLPLSLCGSFRKFHQSGWKWRLFGFMALELHY